MAKPAEWVDLKKDFSPKHKENREKQNQEPADVNISINYPMVYENAIQKLILENDKYKSRSGTIRIAIGEFLKRENKFFRRLRHNG